MKAPLVQTRQGLTQLQADAFVTLDAELASAVRGLVMIGPIEALG